LCWVGGYLVSIFPFFSDGCCWDLSTPNPREDVSHWFDMVLSALHLKPMKPTFFWGGSSAFTEKSSNFSHFFVGKVDFPQHPRYPRFNQKPPKSQRQTKNLGGARSHFRGIELRTPASSDVFVGRFSNATKPQVFIEDLWRSVQKWWVYYWFLDYYGFTIGLLWVYQRLVNLGLLISLDYNEFHAVDSFRLRQLPARPAFFDVDFVPFGTSIWGFWISTWQPEHGVALRVEGHAMGSQRSTKCDNNKMGIKMGT